MNEHRISKKSLKKIYLDDCEQKNDWGFGVRKLGIPMVLVTFGQGRWYITILPF